MEAAEVQKEKGNSLFAKGNYERAASCYQRAFASLETGVSHDSSSSEEEKKEGADFNFSYLQAVCLSNFSNCQFELGNYQQAINKANRCLQLLEKEFTNKDEDEMTTKANGLLQKNLLRIARAQFYLQDWTTAQDTLQKLKESCHGNKKDPYWKRATKMSQQIAQYQSATEIISKEENPPQSKKAVRLLRCAWMEPLNEYYRFGHDPNMSALKHVDDNYNSSGREDTDLHLKDAAPNPLSIFLSGINDGRHVMTTIMHIRQQYEELTQETAKTAKAVLVCNDINRACMAKFVVTMVILDKIGRQAPSIKDLQDTARNDASKWCTVLQYVFLSYAMPDWCNDMLIKVMKEIKEFPSLIAFQESYPWFPGTSERDSWEPVLPILSYWIRQASGDKIKVMEDGFSEEWVDIPSAKESIDRYWELQDEPDPEHVQRMSGKNMDDYMQKRQSAASSHKREAMEELKQISNFTPEMKQMMLKMFPDISTDEEMIEKAAEMMQAIPEEKMMEYNKRHTMIQGIPMAEAFTKKTKAILPPRQHCDNSIFADFYELDEAKEALQAAVMRKEESKTTAMEKHKQLDGKFVRCCKVARDVIEKSWKTNPFMFDPNEYSFNYPENNGTHDFSPITDFVDDFDCEAFCKEPAIPHDFRKTTPIVADESSGLIVKHLSDYVHCFFWNVANALVTVCDAEVLTLEWNVGDVISASQARREQTNKLNKFHRILASNIPDYTGMLAFFTEVMPLLHEPTELVVPTLGVNIYAGPPLWDNYAHYIYGSTAIPTIPKVEAILGMKYLGDPGVDVWQSYYYWTRADGPVKMVSKSELSHWLHQLFLLTCLPGERDVNKRFMIENCPSTAAIFVRACEFCIQRGYPAHWISCALDEILASAAQKPFKTKASIQKSPSRHEQATRMNKLNVSSFIMDLRTQLAIQIKRARGSNQSLLPLESSILLSDAVHQYEIEMPVDFTNSFHLGNCRSTVLSLVLEPTKPKSIQEFEVMEMKLQWTMLGKKPNRPSLRNEIISKGSKAFQLLSCLEFELIGFGKSNRVRFYMSESDFQQYHQSHYLSILRTDGWFRLGDPIQLRHASRVETSHN